MKNLAELRGECAALGIKVETNGRSSKELYVAALRDFIWKRDHGDKPLPRQIRPMLLGSWEDLDEDEAREIEQDCHAWIAQPKLDGVRSLLHCENGRVRITGRTVSDVTELLALNSWQLRDLRLAGRIGFTRIVGNRVRYTLPDLLDYLRQHHEPGKERGR